jgi:glycine/D-amino acid oxidase-like deaminating enzyme
MLDALERHGAAGTVPGEEEEDVFDVLIVGGGATGAGVAVDAASRGLRVALVEQNDFSSGTSCRTTFFSVFNTFIWVVGDATQVRRPSRPSSSMAAYAIYKRR